VELRFEIDGKPALFRRNDMTGRAELQVGDEVRLLQSPWRLSTHFSARTKKVWREQVAGHAIEVHKGRPLAFGGARANSFTVVVDGQTVAESSGK
jgi:hypothetical protein